MARKPAPKKFTEAGSVRPVGKAKKPAPKRSPKQKRY